MAFRRLQRGLQHLDDRLVDLMRDHGVLALRLSLGIVFTWFGLLKIVGESPVGDLVRAVAYLFPGTREIVLLLGIWEVLIGLGLLFAFALRATLLLLGLQLAGTFLVFVVRPDIAFQGTNPFLLTTEGEFVVKNLVLLAAGMVVGGTVRHRRGGGGEGRIEPE